MIARTGFKVFQVFWGRPRRYSTVRPQLRAKSPAHSPSSAKGRFCFFVFLLLSLRIVLLYVMKFHPKHFYGKFRD
jgi:hypothetical protein